MPFLECRRTAIESMMRDAPAVAPAPCSEQSDRKLSYVPAAIFGPAATASLEPNHRKASARQRLRKQPCGWNRSIGSSVYLLCPSTPGPHMLAAMQLLHGLAS